MTAPASHITIKWLTMKCQTMWRISWFFTLVWTIVVTEKAKREKKKKENRIFRQRIIRYTRKLNITKVTKETKYRMNGMNNIPVIYYSHAISMQQKSGEKINFYLKKNKWNIWILKQWEQKSSARIFSFFF